MDQVINNVAASASRSLPEVRKLSTEDLREALRKGLDDFNAMPTHAVFLCVIYPLVALVLSRLVFGYEVLPLLFPLAAGFALVGPLAAIGLYELSRRRELGEDANWRHALGVLRSAATPSILALGAVLAGLFIAWVLAAWLIYAATLGAMPGSVGEFLTELFTTGAGWTLIVVGNGVGLVFAIIALSLSVVSFPMMIDRQVDWLTAMLTSLKTVAANPVPMATWGVIVLAGLLLGSLPLFAALAVIFPILGHATWHLYRRAVVG